MNDFLLEYKNTITFSVEILAAITGLLFYKKYKSTTAKFFIWFLIYVSIGDFSGTYVKYISNDGIFSFLKGTKFARNFWWSTLYWKIGSIVFFSFYFYKILTKTNFKNIIKYGGSIFFVFSIIYILNNLDDYFVRFFPIISVLGAFLIFLCTVFYFIEILQSDKILTFYRSLNFYISAAIFIWWLIITPLVFYDIYNSHHDWNFIFLKWEIYLFSNVLMYLTFTFALIFCIPENEIDKS
ncbi:hypothetical protein N1F78_13825 [Seonamhaeicola sp. MEBiC1930]|uniref:hypothetical protein n=1 Tax=Seonamhaeicola sp. MEBiC01930 TaxID=2976768 RepID=UPI00324A0163